MLLNYISLSVCAHLVLLMPHLQSYTLICHLLSFTQPSPLPLSLPLILRPQVGNGGRPFSPISPTYVPAVHQEVDHFQAPGKNRSVSIPDGRMGMEPSSSYGQPPPLPPPYSANAVAHNGQMADGAHHYFSIATGSGHSPAAGDAGNLQQFPSQYSYLPAKSVSAFAFGGLP